VPALQSLLGYSFRDRLQRMTIPVEVVWGRNDLLVPVGDAERFAELIGDNARHVIFEDTGHLPMLERPSRFNKLLREFAAGDRTPESDVEGVSA
jgi:pimeloyl-ACP methyl ester carboxylesterase